MTSVWNDHFGHDDVIRYFRRVAQHGRLSHAYAFVGPEGIGKRHFAARLARSLLCLTHPESDLEACNECASCRPLIAGNHSDLITIACPEGKKEIPIELFVGSRDHRGQEGLCHELAMAPLTGRRKVAIIDDADKMNDASGNSLLKTLEEPPPGAILLLLVSNYDALLPTIRSRCQPVRFNPLPEDVIANLLVSQGHLATIDEGRAAARLSQGSLAMAIRLHSPEMLQLRTVVQRHLTSDPIAGLSMADAIMELGESADDVRGTIFWAIQFAVELLRTALHSAATDEIVSVEVAKLVARAVEHRDGWWEMFGRMLERCADAAEHLDQFVSPALVLEAWCDDLQQIGHLTAILPARR